MRFFKVTEEVDSRFIFLDSESNQPIDVLNPQYTITHYNANVETVDVPLTALTRLNTGEYIMNWLVPVTAQQNETYFVTASGTHPIFQTTTILEDFFRVVSEDFFPGSGGIGLVIKFAKP